jgi:hypothetical protein
MNSTEKLKRLLKQVVELLMPDFDHYRKPLRKGQVIETYASDGRYICDIKILLNNNQPDEDEPIIKGVELPVIWGGAERGIVCPPAPGTYCDIEYYHGDPDYPRISNIRWHENGAPAVGVDELIIQQKSGVYIHIKEDSTIEIKTPSDRIEIADGKTTIKAGKGVDVDGGSSDLAGVVTKECFCPFIGKMHIDASKNVKASKG